MIAVIAGFIVLLGIISITTTPVDVFPAIDIPVISVVWSYGGLTPSDMEVRIVNQCERGLTTTVSNIEHIESQSYQGISVIKIFFQPGTSIPTAIAQIESSTQTSIRSMPPGITPPLILQFQASDVPIIQLSMSSQTMTPSEINDQATNFVRTPLVTIKGVQVSPPFGGVYRLIAIDLKPQAMYALGISATDITNALAAQNLILPAGDVKIGARDYSVMMNNSTDTVQELNQIPIKMVNGAMVTMQDVAYVHNGHGVQSSMVDVNQQPSVLLTILKSGDASTLDVINRIKAALPGIRAQLPAALNLDLLLDQSIFVKASVDDVIREGVIAACLTALMILLFLGNWRSTIIVFLSIPLSILTSICILSALGMTMNTMTLGGLALAVGILVDDATVEIENTTRNLEEEKLPLHEAILTTASQIALPTLASTLSICIVFIPVAMLSGAARSLFVPLALAVVFAMLASYLLSRTLVTTMMQALLGGHVEQKAEGQANRNFIWATHERINNAFDRLRETHQRNLAWTLEHGLAVMIIFGIVLAASVVLAPNVGEDFFPQVDSGQLRLHVRVPAGTRVEQTARDFGNIERTISTVIPKSETALVLDNIGLAGALNNLFNNSGTIGSADGEIDVSLTANHHSTWDYEAKLRRKLNQTYPQDTFFFQPADITNQILNFGIAAPIDIQVGGPIANESQNLTIARQIQSKVAAIPGVVDCFVYQVTNSPALLVSVDRQKAMQVGLTQSDAASSIMLALSTSFQTSPSYFLDQSNGVIYSVAAQTPQYEVPSMSALLSTPVVATSSGSAPQTPQLLGNLATVSHQTIPMVISHYNIQPVYDVYASVQNRDLGSVSRDINTVLASYRKHLPRGTTLAVQGQVATMNQSFSGLAFGLLFAIVLIYVLLVVNFESWVDPFVILMATPAAICGVIWILYVTRTTFSVPALMGTIMCIGVASANSILLVTAANDYRADGLSAKDAMLLAGRRRLRPVIMTATAMIIGVFPMALGLGTGGEQNAPLGRAVIGGLLAATFSTLLFVPLVYTVFRRKQDVGAGLPVHPTHGFGAADGAGDRHLAPAGGAPAGGSGRKNGSRTAGSGVRGSDAGRPKLRKSRGAAKRETDGDGT